MDRATRTEECQCPISVRHLNMRIRKTVEAFIHDAVALVIGDYYERHAFPTTSFGRWARWAVRPAIPRGLRRHGGDYFCTCLAIEELARWTYCSGKSRWKPG